MNITRTLAILLVLYATAAADDPPAVPAKPIAEKKELLFSDDFEWDPLESTCRHASLSIL